MIAANVHEKHTAARADRLWLIVLGTWFTFVVHAAVFGEWIVDDAAIAFAYARNLAGGHGLVAQPGALPVEGYSSTLWVLCLAGLQRLGIFHPVWTPKFCSLLLIAATYWVLGTLWIRHVASSATYLALALLALSLQTAFVAWSVSGLENALYALVGATLLFTIAESGRAAAGEWWAFGAGAASAAAAMTRPEGIVFGAAYPLIGVPRWRRTGSYVQTVREGAAYGFGLLIPLMIFGAFRYTYFGDMLPNTYYAKGGPTAQAVIDIITLRPRILVKAVELFESIGGRVAAAWFIVAALVGTAFPRLDGSLSLLRRAVSVLLALSIVCYLLLPTDWMSEFRFGTLVYVYFYLYAALIVYAAAERMELPRIRGSWLSTAPILTIAAIAVNTIPRSVAFAHQPTISIEEVRSTVRRFEGFAADLNVQTGSILTADVGGALWFGSLRVVDLGMLSDRTIAHCLGEGIGERNREAFYDYIFEDVQPTFISSRAFHSWLADFGADERFRRDYIGIREYIDQWVFERYGSKVVSGDFVRRELLQGRHGLLERFRERSRGVHYVGCRECDYPEAGGD